MTCVLTFTNDLGTKTKIISLKYTIRLPIYKLFPHLKGFWQQGHIPAVKGGHKPHQTTIQPKPRTRRDSVLMKR